MNTRIQVGNKFMIARIASDSMRPTINRGDLVLLKPCLYKDISVGDCIGFKSDQNIPLIHRVAKKNDSTLLTIGDTNTRADQAITPKEIVGVVSMIKIHTSWVQYGKFFRFAGKCIAQLSLSIINHPQWRLLYTIRFATTSSLRKIVSSTAFVQNHIHPKR